MHTSSSSANRISTQDGTEPRSPAASRHSRKPHKSQGQAIVELAFIAIILTVMMAGTLELGRAFSAWIQVGNMARAGAQYGSIAATLGDENLENVGAAALDDQDAIFGVAPTVDWEVINDEFDFCAVMVTVDYGFSPIINIGPIPENITLSRSTQMRLQFVSALMDMPDEDNPCR